MCTGYQEEFFRACEQGNLASIKRLVEQKRADVTESQNYAIRISSYYGHLKVVQFLLTLPEVDAAAFNNWAIRWACYDGHLSVVLELMPHTPNIPLIVITPELKSLVFKRACDLSSLKLPAELCLEISECIWGPGSGICFGEDKRRKALEKIRFLKITYLK